MFLDDYIVDVLMRDLVGHDRQPSAFLVYLYLLRQAELQAGDTAVISLREVSEGTGLSRRAVQDALGRLHRRKLIGIHRESITAIPEYTVHQPWRRRGS